MVELGRPQALALLMSKDTQARMAWVAAAVQVRENTLLKRAWVGKDACNPIYGCYARHRPIVNVHDSKEVSTTPLWAE